MGDLVTKAIAGRRPREDGTQKCNPQKSKVLFVRVVIVVSLQHWMRTHALGGPHDDYGGCNRRWIQKSDPHYREDMETKNALDNRRSDTHKNQDYFFTQEYQEPMAPSSNTWNSMQQYQTIIGAQASRAVNVYNRPLTLCSQKNQATTGYNRTGICSSLDSDAGKHHVCIKMDKQPNFCKLTGQNNWCDKPGPCMGDPSDLCERGGWCVCQWAFSSAVKQAGCDALEVDCDATSALALRAYEHDRINHSHALKCLKKKCNL